MANHMLIEADHLASEPNCVSAAIAEEQSYPLVSSHTDTGGHWTASDLTSQPNRRLQLRHAAKLGRAGVQGLGIASPREAGPLLRRRPQHGHRGFNGPGPDPDAAANPLRPFRSYDRKVSSGASEAVSAASI